MIAGIILEMPVLNELWETVDDRELMKRNDFFGVGDELIAQVIVSSERTFPYWKGTPWQYLMQLCPDLKTAKVGPRFVHRRNAPISYRQNGYDYSR